MTKQCCFFCRKNLFFKKRIFFLLQKNIFMPRKKNLAVRKKLSLHQENIVNNREHFCEWWSLISHTSDCEPITSNKAIFISISNDRWALYNYRPRLNNYQRMAELFDVKNDQNSEKKTPAVIELIYVGSIWRSVNFSTFCLGCASQ